MIEGIKEAFDTSNERLNSKLDFVIGELASFKRDMTEIKANVSELEVSVADTSDRIGDVETDKLPKMMKHIEQVKKDLEEKILQYEIHERKLNLLIYGVPKSSNENIYKVCFGVLSSLLNITQEEASMSIPLVNAHRLPRRNVAAAGSSDGQQQQHAPDPIILRFGRMIDRDKVLLASQRPRTAQSAEANPAPRITVRTDLPPAMKRRRDRLASTAYHLRKDKHGDENYC